MTEQASIDWSMKRVDGHTLRIEYKITSHADKRIYISDLLPIAGQGGFVLGDKFIVVMNDERPDTVQFARGRVPSEAPISRPVDPGARALDPGKSLTGAAEVGLPLKAQHYRGTAAPLKGTPKYAVLSIDYLEDAHWRELPLQDGRKLTVSSSVDVMKVLRSDRKPIPQ